MPSFALSPARSFAGLAFACARSPAARPSRPSLPPAAPRRRAGAPRRRLARSGPGAPLRACGRPARRRSPLRRASLRPFADVIKDAQRSDGMLTVWQKDDKVWLELKPDDFNQPFFLSPKLKTGIGERNFYGGLMQDNGIVEFRRIHNQVQLIWLQRRLHRRRRARPRRARSRRAIRRACSPARRC